MERWMSIGEAPGYEVSDLGRVRNVRTGRILRSAGRHSGGYCGVCLRHNGETLPRLVHRLVLEAFVGPRPGRCDTRHLNGNREDNRLSNLRWGTRTENMADCLVHGTRNWGEHNGNALLRNAQIQRIRASRLSPTELSERYGVSANSITRILGGRGWSRLPVPADANNGDRRLHANRGERNAQSKLTVRQVLEIRSAEAATGALAAKYNVSAEAIWKIRKRKKWAWL